MFYARMEGARGSAKCLCAGTQSAWRYVDCVPSETFCKHLICKMVWWTSVHSFDWAARKAVLAGRSADDVVADVIAKLKVLFVAR